MNNEEIKALLDEKMTIYRKGMIAMLRECAAHPLWKDKRGEDALRLAADKLEELK